MTVFIEISHRSEGQMKLVQSGPDWAWRFPYETVAEAEADGWEIVGFPSGVGQHGYPLIALRAPNRDR